MTVAPIDLSLYKPVAGQGRSASQIANGFTAIETWSGAQIDPQALKQNGAVVGQGLVWNGSLWVPGDTRYPMAPTMLGPTVPGNNTQAFAANTAVLGPLAGVVAPTTITRIGFSVASGGGTGNIDVGVYYSDDDVTFTRLVSKGSVATPAFGPAVITVASTTLTPVAGRRWYLGFAVSNATPTFACNTTFVPANSFTKATSFPLPASLSAMTGSAIAATLYALV